MTGIMLVRHAQASFGAADYDRLSPLGHEQAAALGRALAARAAPRPVRVYRGRQRRHRETLEGMAPALGLDPAQAVLHPGLDEFDAKGLLGARFGPRGLPQTVREDRKQYFQILRDTVLAWQRDEIADPPESWTAFSDRVAQASAAMLAEDGPVLAVSSGGAISRMIVAALDAPAAQMIQLQLQMKNCAVSRLVGRTGALFLHSFNEAPHLATALDERLLTYA
ncbi:Broad specificity phosphatase PhoE [Gemmobacter megaterium]|uniref:Broad specificity phosphatase PhoE n=1 Tax=Gemmobacter megaterium TaxID=1086013 RepID=A0A1N7N180_9RHOB|nr:histidine phosphatase family protein [Gemmobacter megaterium]GGE12434.1 phosphoglycerate kinase [Gemmobacter megaterium]SIS92137.1 Broad specificity phosphatase PhoE [Gemmobacter megaterium]